MQCVVIDPIECGVIDVQRRGWEFLFSEGLRRRRHYVITGRITLICLGILARFAPEALDLGATRIGLVCDSLTLP